MKKTVGGREQIKHEDDLAIAMATRTWEENHWLLQDWYLEKENPHAWAMQTSESRVKYGAVFSLWQYMMRWL